MPDPVYKILYIDHTAQLSGAELALLNLIRHLDTSRFAPAVLLFTDGPLADQLRRAGIPVHILALDSEINNTTRHAAGKSSALKIGKLFKMLRFILKLRRAISESNPHIVHANSLKADILGGIAGRLAGKPVIWHIHDRFTEDYLPRRVVKIMRRLLRVIPRAVIANSRATAETLLLHPAKPAIIAYPGIDPLPLLPVPPPSPAPDTTVNSVRPSRRVIMVGRICPWKGQDIFIRAAALIHPQLPDVRFEIAGSALFGEHIYENQVRQLVQTLGLQNVVSFLGFRSDVPELISQADLLVHASTTPEPFGQVIVQAMAAGKPVVATRGGGVPEIVLETKTGLLVPMGDPSAMAAAIITIMNNPDQAKAMGCAGKLRFIENFTIQKTVQQVQSAYESLIRI